MLVREHVEQANIGKKGACHMFRHTMATLMLEGGADIRFIQQMLGHADLNSTEIYTHVAIRKLKQIHAATHPGAALEKKKTAAGSASQEREQCKAALLEALGSEADEEKESE
jgi:integrase/recombinase XerD